MVKLTDTQVLVAHGEQRRMRRLLVYRLLIAVLLLSIGAYFFFQPLPMLKRQVLLLVVSGFMVFILFQALLLKSRLAYQSQIGIQFCADVLLITGLLFATGGVTSPFAFLYGLVIVAAGALAGPMVVLGLTVIGCASYLAAVYAHIWVTMAQMSIDLSLNVLLQASALLLVGGVMAAMANRRQQMVLETRQAYRQHRSLQELHLQIMEEMQEGIMMLDASMQIQDSNAAAGRILNGLVLPGSMLSDVLTLPDDFLAYFTAGGRGQYRQEWNERERIWLVAVTPLPTTMPEAMWLMSVVDLSEIRALQRRLATQDKLAAMGKMAAMLAHDIRNPLQTISQAADLWPRSGSAQEDELYDIVQSEISRLNRTVTDMLDFVSPLRPQPARVRMEPLLQASIKQADLKGEHGIDCQCALEKLQVDAGHFRLVVDNLLNNAVAASPEAGSVRVSLTPWGEAHWRLQVSDHGGGIPEHMRDKIFEPFVSGRQDGMGLGLTTVKQVSEANRWQLDVDSNEQGATISVIGGAG
ncbi:MAG: ATP-binding protein [Mariprofundaceae bacterium]